MEIDWRFGIVGNIVSEHRLEDGKVVHGTKEFAGGTKVYIDGKNWYNYPRTKIVVIGMGRYKKYEIVQVEPDLIENVRFQLIRKKEVLNILESIDAMDGWQWYGRTADDKKEAKKIVANWESIVLQEARNNRVNDQVN